MKDLDTGEDGVGMTAVSRTSYNDYPAEVGSYPRAVDYSCHRG